MLEHTAVGVVGGGDDDHVDAARLDEVARVPEGGHLGPGHLDRPSEGVPVGIGDGHDLGARQGREAPQVLEPHHPRPDDAVAQHRAVHGSGSPSEASTMR